MDIYTLLRPDIVIYGWLISEFNPIGLKTDHYHVMQGFPQRILFSFVTCILELFRMSFTDTGLHTKDETRKTT